MFKSNSYHDGKVASIAFAGEQLPATVGVMAAGEYSFSTSERETMRVISGELTVRLPGEAQWKTFTAGQEFIVAAQASFDVRVSRDTAYLCLYG